MGVEGGKERQKGPIFTAANREERETKEGEERERVLRNSFDNTPH